MNNKTYTRRFFAYEVRQDNKVVALMNGVHISSSDDLPEAVFGTLYRKHLQESQEMYADCDIFYTAFNLC